tara:strand:- start:58 stop:234 length:177 start_codon:yes stop_codon:yes gene_type:complete
MDTLCMQWFPGPLPVPPAATTTALPPSPRALDPVTIIGIVVASVIASSIVFVAIGRYR